MRFGKQASNLVSGHRDSSLTQQARATSRS
jgi:hypothetical protein